MKSCNAKRRRQLKRGPKKSVGLITIIQRETSKNFLVTRFMGEVLEWSSTVTGSNFFPATALNMPQVGS